MPAETVNVKPTPIQRNTSDVALELTKEFFRLSASGVDSVEDLTKVYAQIYAVAEYCRLDNSKIAREVSEEVKTYLTSK